MTEAGSGAGAGAEIASGESTLEMPALRRDADQLIALIRNSR